NYRGGRFGFVTGDVQLKSVTLVTSFLSCDRQMPDRSLAIETVRKGLNRLDQVLERATNVVILELRPAERIVGATGKHCSTPIAVKLWRVAHRSRGFGRRVYDSNRPSRQLLCGVNRQIGFGQLASDPHHPECLSPVIQSRESRDRSQQIDHPRQI